MAHQITQINPDGPITGLIVRACDGTESGRAKRKVGPGRAVTGAVRITREGGHSGGLIIKITEGSRALIAGDDLYALVAMIEEMPEAIKHPPASKVIPWVDGDVLRLRCERSFHYVRVLGEWRAFGRDTNLEWRQGDDWAERSLSRQVSDRYATETVIRGGTNRLP